MKVANIANLLTNLVVLLINIPNLMLYKEKSYSLSKHFFLFPTVLMLLTDWSKLFFPLQFSSFIFIDWIRKL